MAVYDPHFGGYRIFIGDLGQRTSRYDIEKEYERYGKLLDVWVARNPPGFAFIVFKHLDECERAVRKSHGRELCGRRVRVEYARPFDDRSGKQPTTPMSSTIKPRSHSRSPARRRSRHSDSSDRHRHRHRSRDRRDNFIRSRSRSRNRRSNGRSRHHHHHRSPHHHKSTRYSRGRSRSSTRGGSSSPSHTEGTYAPISSRSQHSHSDTEASECGTVGSYPSSDAELTIKDSV